MVMVVWRIDAKCNRDLGEESAGLEGETVGCTLERLPLRERPQPAVRIRRSATNGFPLSVPFELERDGYAGSGTSLGSVEDMCRDSSHHSTSFSRDRKSTRLNSS